MSNKTLAAVGKVKRHSYFTVFLHWLLVLTIIFEIITVNIKSARELHIFGGYSLGLLLAIHLIYHYFVRGVSAIFPRKGDIKASILLLKATLKGNKEPPNSKYLPEQRLAYLYILFTLILVFITGIGRVLGGEHRHSAVENITFGRMLGMLHGPAVFLLIIGIIAHLLAFTIKANRPLLSSMFNGRVDLKYVKERHKIWYSELQKKQKNN